MLEQECKRLNFYQVARRVLANSSSSVLHKEQRWTAAGFSSQEAYSWFNSSSVDRCCLDIWHCNRLRLCLIQVPGVRCLAAANLILLGARCSSDPKGNKRDMHDQNFIMCQLLTRHVGNSWSNYVITLWCLRWCYGCVSKHSVLFT